MGNAPDKLFLRAFRWFGSAVTALETDATGNAALLAALEDFLRKRVGLRLDKTPATLTLDDFNVGNPQAQSLALAMAIVGESLSAQDGTPGLTDLGQVIGQVERLLKPQPSKPPSAYSIAKLLFTLSGDADLADNVPEAKQLVKLVTGLETGSADYAHASTSLALIVMAIGTILDRSYSAPPASAALGWVENAVVPFPALGGLPHISLPALQGSNIQLGFVASPPALLIDLDSGFIQQTALGGSQFNIELIASGQLQARIEEEEIPREGIEIKRQFQYARGAQGQAFLWLGRSKKTARGESSSGLRFDALGTLPV